MEWPLVSVVIATYNRNETLMHALASIDYPNCEVIIVDDGSDPPVNNVLSFDGYPNVKLVTKSNGGVSSARNAAMDEATGTYVAHLDSDDLFVPGKLQRLVRLLEENSDVDFAFHDIDRFRYRDGRATPLPKRHSEYYPAFKNHCTEARAIDGDRAAYRVPSVVAFESLTSGNAIFPSSAILRRSLTDRLDPWDVTLRNCNDMEYFGRALCHSDAVYVDEALSKMGVGDDNLSQNNLVQILADVKILDKFQQMPLSDTHARALGRSIYTRNAALGWHYRNAGEWIKARAAYKAALNQGFSIKLCAHYLVLTLRTLSRA